MGHGQEIPVGHQGRRSSRGTADCDVLSKAGVQLAGVGGQEDEEAFMLLGKFIPGNIEM